MIKEIDLPDRPGYVITYEGSSDYPFNIHIMHKINRKPLKTWSLSPRLSEFVAQPHWIWQKASGKYGTTLYDNNLKEYIRITAPSAPCTEQRLHA
jgi:hypothetical protein